YNHLDVETAATDNWLVFFKLSPTVITPDNLHSNILVSSLLDSPLDTLYHTLQKVYSPVLLRDERWSRSVDPKIQSLLGDLEAGLGTALRRFGKIGISVPHTTGEADESSQLSTILCPSDEFQFWAEAALSEAKLAQRERGQRFQELFQPVTAKFANLDSLSFSEALELVEVCQDTLDDVWKETEFDPPYPENRMKHLLEVISDSFARFVQRKLHGCDLWMGQFSQVRTRVQDGLMVCDKWSSAAEALTVQYWKQYALHRWRGGAFVSGSLSQLTLRLEEVLSLRSVHEQLLHLLSPSQQQQLNLTASFSPFTGLDPLQYNPYTEPLWRAAVAQYDRGMVPAESSIAGKLRSRFHQLEAQPHQLLQEFQRYKELVKRPTISKELMPERETLLGQLTSYLRSLRDTYTNLSSSHPHIPSSHPHRDPAQLAAAEKLAPPTGKNMPVVVNNIIWTRQLEAKVSETISTAEALLGDLSGFQSFCNEGRGLGEELREYQREQLDQWSRQTLAAIDHPSEPLSLETSGRLMEFDGRDGKLRVHYSDRLVALLREVRQLSALGLSLPTKIITTAQTARKFYRHGVVLKQVAHFYNTIDHQMLPSQQPMMLDTALAFERLIKNPKAGNARTKPRGKEGEGGVQITWDSVEQLEEYTGRLRAAAEKLTSENRRLRRCHADLVARVGAVMSVDLLRQPQRWKDLLMDIRHTMASLIQEGFNAGHMRSWRLHWDHQLYKALEHQYQLGLEALSEHLPEIKVEMIFRHQRLQFRPSLEEIRAKYFRELRKFISIPLHFRGVTEAASPAQTIFPRMVLRNSSGLSTVYHKAEQLFHRLGQAREMFREWVTLGCVDIPALVEAHCSTVADWEMNIRALKTKGREAEKLPNTIRIDCITVSSLPVKSSIDDQIQQLFDALLNSLRHSISQHLQAIDVFLGEARDSLSIRPQTVEEIGQVNIRHAELAKKKPEIEPQFAVAEQKNKLLRSVAGGGMDELPELRTQWDKFEIMMESHQMMIRDQMQVMCSRVEGEVHTFVQEVEKFSARWEQLKPKADFLDGDRATYTSALASLKDRRNEFDELLKTADKLKLECEHFSLPAPDLSLLEAVETDMSEQEETWALYEEFSSALDGLCGEDWISFR
ncbi:Cytoplasmic dynein 2 heavy chain 1, partial [Geodia barretti]